MGAHRLPGSGRRTPAMYTGCPGRSQMERCPPNRINSRDRLPRHFGAAGEQFSLFSRVNLLRKLVENVLTFGSRSIPVLVAPNKLSREGSRLTAFDREDAMRFRPCGRLVSVPAFSLAPKHVDHERRLRQRVRRRHDDQHDDRQRRIKVMKFLLSSVAIVAALAIASPVSAQGYGPGPGARTGTGPGVTPPGGLGPSSPLSNLP